MSRLLKTAFLVASAFLVSDCVGATRRVTADGAIADLARGGGEPAAATDNSVERPSDAVLDQPWPRFVDVTSDDATDAVTADSSFCALDMHANPPDQLSDGRLPDLSADGLADTVESGEGPQGPDGSEAWTEISSCDSDVSGPEASADTSLAADTGGETFECLEVSGLFACSSGTDPMAVAKLVKGYAAGALGPGDNSVLPELAALCCHPSDVLPQLDLSQVTVVWMVEKVKDICTPFLHVTEAVKCGEEMIVSYQLDPDPPYCATIYWVCALTILDGTADEVTVVKEDGSGQPWEP